MGTARLLGRDRASLGERRCAVSRFRVQDHLAPLFSAACSMWPPTLSASFPAPLTVLQAATARRTGRRRPDAAKRIARVMNRLPEGDATGRVPGLVVRGPGVLGRVLDLSNNAGNVTPRPLDGVAGRHKRDEREQPEERERDGHLTPHMAPP